MSTFESDLAHKFAPTYHWSEGEGNCLVELDPNKERPTFLLGHPPWKPYVYFSVLHLGMGQFGDAYEINYLTIWEWDAGLPRFNNIGPHQWDIERTAVFVVGPTGSREAEGYRSYQAYYAAHEGMKLLWYSVDASDWLPRRMKEVSSEVWSEGKDVYWSKGKHASFRSLKKLRSSRAFDSYDHPQQDTGIKPQDYTLADVGTLEEPTARWITWEKDWAPRVPSVRSKLECPLWNSDGGRQRRLPRAPKRDDIEKLQLALQLEPTRRLDVATMERIAGVVPQDLLWTQQEIPEEEVRKAMAGYGIDASGLELK